MSRLAHAAVAPFVVENTSCSVDSSYGRFVAGVRDATPQVDDLAALDVQTEAGTDVAVLLEVAYERVAHAFEARLDDSIDVHVAPLSSLGACSTRYRLRGVATSSDPEPNRVHARMRP